MRAFQIVWMGIHVQVDFIILLSFEYWWGHVLGELRHEKAQKLIRNPVLAVLVLSSWVAADFLEARARARARGTAKQNPFRSRLPLASAGAMKLALFWCSKGSLDRPCLPFDGVEVVTMGCCFARTSQVEAGDLEFQSGPRCPSLTVMGLI